VVEPGLRVTTDSTPTSAGAWRVVRVTGEIDIQSSPILDEHLQKAQGEGASSIVVDLSEVTFLDSTGLSVLVTALQRGQDAGGGVRLTSPRPNVRRVLEVTGLAEVFHVEPPSLDPDGPATEATEATD
jgi:anti-sigma B factor antagonist